MRKLSVLGVLFVLAVLLSVTLAPTNAQADTSEDHACWGQASAVFAKRGEMGKHASEQDEPRDGLRNLARYLYYEEGVIDEPTLQALGAYVAAAWGLSIEACM
jgi:hypothetical protein